MMGWNASLSLFLLGCCCRAETSTRVIDLSFLHSIDAETLAGAILQAQEQPPRKVDVSNSALGDEGVEAILQSMLSCCRADKAAAEATTESSTESSSLSLIAQANGVTPKGATKLIQKILSEGQGNVDYIDLSWNHLHSDAPGSNAFHKALEKLMANANQCPRVLRFDRCGLNPSTCRAIGKGIIDRFAQHQDSDPLSPQSATASLFLCGNTAIGDAGAAAIAAALRFVATSKIKNNDCSTALFEHLDLSACEIGDTGAEAIALALESAPFLLVQHLDLSSNRISERGSQALARALATAACNRRDPFPLLLSLDLSSNNIGDAGATAMATCLFYKNLVPNTSLRSCNIHADGAESIGRALRQFARGGTSSDFLSLDLSGNPFGVLRGKTAKDGGKYSASRLKSKASATAVSYMNHGISFLRKGLKDVGVDMGLSSTVESDDEEEKRTETDSLMDGDIDPLRARCGGRALSSGFAANDNDKNNSDKRLRSESGALPRIVLGLRHCYFDHAAADALAEMKVLAKGEFGVDVEFDVRLNAVLEDDMVSALHGKDDDHLREMAEAHSDKIRIIREAQERAKVAGRDFAPTGTRATNEGNNWDTYSGYDDDFVAGDEQWDLDADYENEETLY
jgi:hypothetical protein